MGLIGEEGIIESGGFRGKWFYGFCEIFEQFYGFETSATIPLVASKG